MSRQHRPPYILVLPSLFTTGNLFCGFYAIIYSFTGRLNFAAIAIFIAIVFDSLDGRVARMTRTQSRFGVEYDSIADVISFGVAPAVISYTWGLQSLGRLGFGATFFYLACAALRLARFNTVTEAMPKSYFIGLPSPAAAAGIASLVLARQQLGIQSPGPLLLGFAVGLGILMVSNIRYPSFKDLDLRERRRFPLLVGLLGALIFIIWEPEIALAVLLAYYILLGLIREALGGVKRLVAGRGRLSGRTSFSVPSQRGTTDSEES